MKKRFLPLSMLLITMVLAQASFVANAAGIQGKYTPRTGSKATISSFMKSIRANQETGLIDPALLIQGQKAAQKSSRDVDLTWNYAGPDNFGGLTRAIIYNNDGTVIIGTMGGDLYKTTNGGITFQRITNLSLPISCMVKNSAGDIFIGTGEGREAQNLNGLADLNYDASFIGRGIYKMAAGTTTPELLASTTPTATNGWGYVNELAFTNGKIYAATAAGIMVSADNGESWTNAQAGNFRSVKVNNNGDVLAADDADVYLSKAGGTFNNVTDGIAANSNPKIIAMSPTDANYMYIAYLNGSFGDYTSGNIYFTKDGGANWDIAMAGTSLYAIFNSDANNEGFMIVYPNNPRRLLIGSDDIWSFEDITGQGVNSYRPQRVSENFTSEYSSVYVHMGIQTIAFNPSNPGIFFVGTNGGVFKGIYSQSTYSFTGSNRYFITDDEHCSTARMMSVGVGGMSSYSVLGGSLDHGTIILSGSELINNITTGEVVFPHVTNNGYASSLFDKTYAGGPCAVSTINPFIFFVSATGSLSTPIYRSQTLGVDFDGNFEGGGDDPVVTNANAFKTPFAFFENYNDDNNPVNTLYAPIRRIKHVGDLVYAYSLQGGYPVDYYIKASDATHTDEQGNPCCMPGDTIRDIHDPLSSLYVVGVEGKLYMTREALIFNKATEWDLISSLEGIPTVVAISGDGDMAMVGTAEGNLFKVTGLANAYTPAQASVDSAACVVTFSQLTGFSGQAITGISIDPSNKNNVLVSLGNYGNTAYAYRSTNAGTSFESVQGNLPQVPAYSCLIEKNTGLLMVGTENGLYVSENGSTWTKSGAAACPVMDIKQAVIKNHDAKVDTLYDEAGTMTLVLYPGVNNEGMIYAATYGAGIVSCDDFAFVDESGDDNNDPTAATEAEELSIYPNPVRDFAQFDITVDNSASVSFVIYDLSGRMINNGDLGRFSKGTHTLNVDTKDLARGSYIIRVKAGDKTETGKFLVY